MCFEKNISKTYLRISKHDTTFASKSYLADFKVFNPSLLNATTKVTKADIITEIAHRTNIDKGYVQASIESFFDVIKDSMERGENIYVRGFGSFVNKRRARKVARNISKKTSIIIPEHFVPSFKPSKVFVEQIKNSEKMKTEVESL